MSSPPPWAGGGAAPAAPATPKWAATAPAAPAAPWAATGAGADHAATALDKPAFDYDIANEPPPGFGGGGPAPALDRGPGHAPPPPARRLPPAKPVPKSDTALYIGLGAVVLLIFGVIIAIIIGVASEVGSDDEETTEQVED